MTDADLAALLAAKGWQRCTCCHRIVPYWQLRGGRCRDVSDCRDAYGLWWYSTHETTPHRWEREAVPMEMDEEGEGMPIDEPTAPVQAALPVKRTKEPEAPVWEPWSRLESSQGEIDFE